MVVKNEFGLTEMEEQFCQALVDDSKANGTHAAIVAGYSEKTARVQASQLLTRLNIRHRLRELRREALEASGYDKEKVRDMIYRRLVSVIDTQLTDVVHVSPDKKDPQRQEVLKKIADMHGGQMPIDFGEIMVVPTTELTDNEAAALRSIKFGKFGIEVDMHDPIAAAKLLAEITGLKQADTTVNIALSDRLEKARRRAAATVANDE